MPRTITRPRSTPGPRVRTKRRGATAAALLAIPLICLGLAACGGSSGGSSSSSSSANQASSSAMGTTASTPTASAPATTTPPPASTGTTSTSTEPSITTARQFALIYECLRHSGVSQLPPLVNGKLPGKLPNINTNTPQYKAILTTCRRKVLGS